ncbi:hypothetical protein [Dyadobacter sp. Leaf189]|uniref:hypothetical protein n=1 Tax=Dyadobacter sp. Leaf189 TaxID=1736295 RepID=UPI0006F3FB69|nr:hypothetical protein [Dyadobacter sp. Leaf189]KQS34013.1 hypothetical protein ASG33_08255 [Dyadobacter sp. Leaf189]
MEAVVISPFQQRKQEKYRKVYDTYKSLKASGVKSRAAVEHIRINSELICGEPIDSFETVYRTIRRMKDEEEKLMRKTARQIN